MATKIGLFLLLAVRTISASPIISTFGSGDGFINFGGSQVGGGLVTGHPAEVAAEFTPSQDYALEQIRVAVLDITPRTGDHDLVVDLSEGDQPGTPIETFGTTIADGFGQIYTFNSILFPTLLAGQTYWITLTSNDLVNNLFAWDTDTAGRSVLTAERTPGSSLWREFYDYPAFDVSGEPFAATSVPEPSSAFLLVPGLCLLAAGKWTGDGVVTMFRTYSPFWLPFSFSRLMRVLPVRLRRSYKKTKPQSGREANAKQSYQIRVAR